MKTQAVILNKEIFQSKKAKNALKYGQLLKNFQTDNLLNLLWKCLTQSSFWCQLIDSEKTV